MLYEVITIRLGPEESGSWAHPPSAVRRRPMTRIALLHPRTYGNFSDLLSIEDQIGSLISVELTDQSRQRIVSQIPDYDLLQLFSIH